MVAPRIGLALGVAGCSGVSTNPGVIVDPGDDDATAAGDDDATAPPDDDTSPPDDDAGDDDVTLPEECGGGPVWDLQGTEAGLPDPYQAMEEAAQAPNDPGGFGGALLDFDGDGHLDFFATQSNLNPPSMWWNQGDGTFVDGYATMGVELTGAFTRTASAADYDGDGDFDLLVLSHGMHDDDDGHAPLNLLRNEGGRVFTDVTAGSGLDDGVNRLGFGGSWGDYDQDGDLDLFIANHFYMEDWAALSDGEAVGDGCRMMRNDGDGTFTEVTSDFPEGSMIGLAYQGYWIDLDGDDDLDLVVGNDYGFLVIPDKAFRNDGPDGSAGWRWTDITDDVGLGVSDNVMGLAFGDPDEDGDFDHAVTLIGGIYILEQVAPLQYFDITATSFAAFTAGGGVHNIGWGVAYEDLDNDGHEDLLATFADLPGDESGEFGEGEQVPQLNALFFGKGDGDMEYAGEDHELADFGKARSLAFADLNGDGTLDVLMGGSVSGAPHLYVSRPECSTDRWLAVEVRSNSPMNRYGVGATVRARTGDRVQVRHVDGGYRVSMSTSPPIVHFGLGNAAQVDEVEVVTGVGDHVTAGPFARGQRVTIEVP